MESIKIRVLLQTYTTYNIVLHNKTKHSATYCPVPLCQSIIRLLNRLTNIYKKIRTLEKLIFTLEKATKTQIGVEVHMYSFFNIASRWVGG